MIPAALFSLLVLTAPAQAQQDPRPETVGEFYEVCERVTVVCEEAMSQYILRYAAVRVPALARQERFKTIRDNMADPRAFDGICLPEKKLLGEDMPAELSKAFRRWARKHPEAKATRIPEGMRAAMLESYPCR